MKEEEARTPDISLKEIFEDDEWIIKEVQTDIFGDVKYIATNGKITVENYVGIEYFTRLNRIHKKYLNGLRRP